MASIRVPSRRTGTGGGGCRAAVKYVLLATAAAWCGYFVAVARHSKDETVALSALRRPGPPADSTRRLREDYPPINSLAQELEVTVMANSLTQALEAAMEASRPFPFERISLLHHTMLLTGHPPLVSRSDASVDGLPDFTSFGLPPTIPHPQFMVVDPWVGLDGSSEQTTGNTRQITDNPFRYVVKNEDAVRDVVVAMLASGGHQRDASRAGVDCRASPVTSPFACIASLRTEVPQRFESGAAGLKPRRAGEVAHALQRACKHDGHA